MQAVLVVEVSFGQVQPCLDAVEPFDIDSVAEVGRLVAVAPSLVGQPFVGVVEAVVGVVASSFADVVDMDCKVVVEASLAVGVGLDLEHRVVGAALVHLVDSDSVDSSSSFVDVVVVVVAVAFVVDTDCTSVAVVVVAAVVLVPFDSLLVAVVVVVEFVAAFVVVVVAAAELLLFVFCLFLVTKSLIKLNVKLELALSGCSYIQKLILF